MGKEEPKQMDDQEMMVETAKKVKERVTQELPYLENVMNICSKKHPFPAAPMAAMMHSFARFTNSDENERLLGLVTELFNAFLNAENVQLVVSKKERRMESSDIRNARTILNTLADHKKKIDECLKDGQMFDYMMDFFPFVRQYQLMLVHGHYTNAEEEKVCNDILALMKTVAERNIQDCHTAIATCEKLLNNGVEQG